MKQIDQIVLLRKLLGIYQPDDELWYQRSDFDPQYYPALIGLYKYYCSVQGICLKSYEVLYI